MFVTATMDEDLPDSIWSQQAVQVSQHRMGIGIVHKPDGVCERLLFYDDGGDLRGIFKYFPEEVPNIADAGEFVIIVDPSRRRLGIGRTLLNAATARWNVNFDLQRYTPSGAALVNRFLASEQP